MDREAQTLIAHYGEERFGRALFTPLHPHDEAAMGTNESARVNDP